MLQDGRVLLYEIDLPVDCREEIFRNWVVFWKNEKDIKHSKLLVINATVKHQNDMLSNPVSKNICALWIGSYKLADSYSSHTHTSPWYLIEDHRFFNGYMTIYNFIHMYFNFF